jgi:hypothetical protein
MVWLHLLARLTIRVGVVVVDRLEIVVVLLENQVGLLDHQVDVLNNQHLLVYRKHFWVDSNVNFPDNYPPIERHSHTWKTGYSRWGEHEKLVHFQRNLVYHLLLVDLLVVAKDYRLLLVARAVLVLLVANKDHRLGLLGMLDILLVLAVRDTEPNADNYKLQ